MTRTLRFLLPGLLGLLAASTVWARALDAERGLTPTSRAALYELLLSSQARTLRLLADVPEELFAKAPAPGRWSAAEVLEHLGRAEVQVRGVVDRLVAGPPHPEWRSMERPSLNELVALASDRSRKFQAPEPLTPQGGRPRAELLDAYLEQRAVTLELVRTTQAPLRIVAAEAPIGRLLDGEGWLALLAAHNERHNAQLVEIRAQLGLPAVD